MLIKGILFDLDGVIVDTLHYHFLAWKEMFGRMGGKVQELTVLLHEGRSSKELMPILLEEAGLEFPKEKWDNFIETKREYYRSIVNVTFYPQVIETITKLKKSGYKLALITACAKKNMHKALSDEHQSLFDVIVTGDDMPRGKPNPDPYEIGRDKLKLKNGECLVVENAPLGILSAKAAGITCAAVSTTLPKKYLQKADIFLNHIEDIFKYLVSVRKVRIRRR
ncbi:MAG: HAD family phosphatase [Candidatus Cloacimonadota bacterium]|nr:HAD family phosphatase [Candidatus Cloacimonadota bacterium]